MDADSVPEFGRSQEVVEDQRHGIMIRLADESANPRDVGGMEVKSSTHQHERTGVSIEVNAVRLSMVSKAQYDMQRARVGKILSHSPLQPLRCPAENVMYFERRCKQSKDFGFIQKNDESISCNQVFFF